MIVCYNLYLLLGYLKSYFFFHFLFLCLLQCLLLFSFPSFFVSSPFSFFGDISLIFIASFVVFIKLFVSLRSPILFEHSFIFFLISVDNSVIETILYFFLDFFVLEFNFLCYFVDKSCPLFFILFLVILFNVIFFTINLGFELLNGFFFV